MNKNPFEIRAEMLQLAKEYMDKQQEMNIQLMNDLVDHGKKHMIDQLRKDGHEIAMADVYKMYSIEELMEKAKQMYSFVSTKD